MEGRVREWERDLEEEMAALEELVTLGQMVARANPRVPPKALLDDDVEELVWQVVLVKLVFDQKCCSV